MEVDYKKVGANVDCPVEEVNHKDLERFSDESYWKRICPKCGGLLLVRRNQTNFHIMAEDFCTLCGQQYLYKDILSLSPTDREMLASA